jgi:hypothetical protein
LINSRPSGFPTKEVIEPPIRKSTPTLILSFSKKLISGSSLGGAPQLLPPDKSAKIIPSAVQIPSAPSRKPRGTKLLDEKKE